MHGEASVAYPVTVVTYAGKLFITLSPGANVTKLFSLSMTAGLNKLERSLNFLVRPELTLVEHHYVGWLQVLLEKI